MSLVHGTRPTDHDSPAPHDRLFRQVFSQPVRAAGELRQVLPVAIVQAIDWSTLRVCDDTFVDGG